ncbi:hypothetical protein F4813DRAFT_190399 [Daldinia decipiens]|uniref:uncharacterized protein n=1 Tax=Daldinia decipiens TaxID=326647 RepID=UPI0020C4F426|nr:uncharacterized protein F4813DRAFT_190399 [Daldinia decipiens]KAI1655120.1 hypothetical protein F4813DRAFT_190399 [Daldinia decipiens]
MSGWKDKGMGIVKNGWHPEKEGTSLKGQVKGLIGRGDKSSSHSSSERSATPITSLRDPSSFGPPPKRTAVSGNATESGSQSPVSSAHSGHTYGVQQQHQHQVEEPTVESRPYRVDTTGLSTANLPPPPVRRGSPDKRDPVPPPSSHFRPSGPPSLPPRLPPRSGNASPVQSQSPFSTRNNQSSNYLNQGAINRLGAAGISVPGLGIGGKAGSSAPPPPARSPTTASSARGLSTKPSNGQLNELQSRFSRLGAGNTQQDPTTAPAQGTTWAEKQAAFKTATSFRKDPSSVSFADVKAAAGTAYNFQQRHGDQVASGLKTANELNQRFGGVEANGQGTTTSPMGQISGFIGKKKPPPPPPAKKPQLSGDGSESVPPPVPLASRPKF